MASAPIHVQGESRRIAGPLQSELREPLLWGPLTQTHEVYHQAAGEVASRALQATSFTVMLPPRSLAWPDQNCQLDTPRIT